MQMRAADDREYWLRVLAAGGTTAVPRWATDPEPGIGDHVAPIPTEVLAALDARPYGPDVPFVSLLLTAHAAVLAALSGERDVVTGYLPAGADRPLPCPLSAEPGTWRELLARTVTAERELLAHAGFPVAELLRDSGLAGPRSETVFGAGHEATDLPDDVVLRVGVTESDGRPAVHLRYRLEALDGAAAASIAGYHLAALHRLATEPDTAHDEHSLLSAEEIAFQLDGLAGPQRELPDQRFHELFEQRVRRHPDVVAAEHAGRRWTYRELNARANRIAHALRARGLATEGVVAVATERNLDWMASVIAVFKAGGVYLPIEPHLPADRIATTLRRAECGIVLTEPGSTGTLDQALRALPEVQRVLVETVYAEQHPDTDPGVPVGPGQLAYIYFTSGSTGEPKGAMCEHAGMLNHLQAKIADLEIGEGQTVAQTAPQCFDISLWQLISALLVGGRTLLVPQDVILDVARFVETIADGRVNVLQIVPSYLEVVLTYLEQHPRPEGGAVLPDLHCASVTGEALKLELAQRWFSVMPGIKLVNAYGLTETSDDTNHEVMRSAPEGRSVPLGPAVQNVRVYVVDEKLRPVPLGAPGAIVFSGVCVGRGYINDPERTAAAYLSDPHRPGERLYQAGDFGRWRPDGKLEFLGRRDSQVKISGFRIEIGEIENILLRAPGVRDGAVVVADGPGGTKHLVAFYAADRPLSPDLLRDRLAESLPGYMVPSAFHWREALPLTANSKIDKKALTALAAELDVVDEDVEPPATPTEQRLAAAWATVLGVPVEQVGRRDHFFDKGGTSLSAVKVAIALKREVSLKEITRQPVLADLAALVDGRTERQTGLLQTLAEPTAPAAVEGTALVCFPYAGGNAVNFRPMADALRGSGVAVFAVELPGHDLAAEREPFLPIDQVVARVVAELDTELGRRGLTRVMLWGHSSGTALAVAAARALHERGVPVSRLFLAAQLPRDPAVRRAEADDLVGRGDAEIAARLGTDSGYTELGELDAQRAEHVGAAYRHDCVTAHRYLADLLEAVPGPIPVPATVVVAADDPSTDEFAHRHRDWQLVAEHVDLEQLPDGGHYFLRTRPAEAADVVHRAARLLPSR
jgi:amino acid adenylation domain-containing protein